MIKFFEALGFSHEYPDYLLLVHGEHHIVIGDIESPLSLSAMPLSHPLHVQVQINNGARTIESHDARNAEHAAEIVREILERLT